MKNPKDSADIGVEAYRKPRRSLVEREYLSRDEADKPKLDPRSEGIESYELDLFISLKSRVHAVSLAFTQAYLGAFLLLG